MRSVQDYKTAVLTFENTNYYGQVCFLSHQAIEKQLKGSLILKGQKPERIHYNERLLDHYGVYDNQIRKFKKDLRYLDRYYISSRYPKEGILFEKKQAKRCLQTAERFLEAMGHDKDFIESPS